MTCLLDVNVLIALAWPNHVHHQPALRWFQEHHRAGWATCPLTQSSFVRVSSNSRILAQAVTPREAVLLLRRIVALPHHVFWVDDFSLADSDLPETTSFVGHRQVTDLHLLALALRYGGRLATLDRAILSLIPDRFRANDPVWLLPGIEH